jgi:acyl-CoA thioesterase-1
MRTALPAAALLLFLAFARLAFAEPAPEAQKAQERTQFSVAFLGDGFFSNPGLAKEQSFPEILKEKLALKGYQITIQDYSSPTLTSKEALGKMKDVLTAKPDAVLVHVGYQDLYGKIDPNDIFNNLLAVLHNLERYDVPTLFYGADVPHNLYEAFAYNVELAGRYKDRFSQMFPKLASMHRVMYRPSLVESIAGQGYYLMPDRIHPNNRGVRSAAGDAAPDLIRLLKYHDDPVMQHNLSYNSPKNVVVYGEQLTSTYKKYEDISFANLLEKYATQHRRKTNVTFYNLSTPTMTSETGSPRIKQIMRLRPDVVLLQLGVNDMAVDGDLGDPNIIASRIAMTAKALEGSGAKTVLLGVRNPLVAEGFGFRISRFNKMYGYVGKLLGVPVVEDALAGVRGYVPGTPRLILDKESMKRVVLNVYPPLEELLVAKEKAEREKAKEAR